MNEAGRASIWKIPPTSPARFGTEKENPRKTIANNYKSKFDQLNISRFRLPVKFESEFLHNCNALLCLGGALTIARFARSCGFRNYIHRNNTVDCRQRRLDRLWRVPRYNRWVGNNGEITVWAKLIWEIYTQCFRFSVCFFSRWAKQYEGLFKRYSEEGFLCRFTDINVELENSQAKKLSFLSRMWTLREHSNRGSWCFIIPDPIL